MAKIALKISEYKNLLKGILSVVEDGKIKVVKGISYTQINMYFQIGKLIVDTQMQEDKSVLVVEKLSVDLTKLMNFERGYSTQNLWYMRQMYSEYKDNKKLQQLALQIPWGQNIEIFSKLKDTKERIFYMQKIIESAWSRSILINQIKADIFNKQSTKEKNNNFKAVLPAHYSEQATEILKSEYILDFVASKKRLLERDLEEQLIAKIKEFILELGYGFTFIGNQYKLRLNKKEYAVDLLFFHRKLKCLVAIDLKIGSFEPEATGKMNFYLNLLNQQVKLPDENPSIGIILCAEKDSMVVEIALKGINNPIGVSEYVFGKKIPIDLKGKLPNLKLLETALKDEFKKQK
jgi:predicted nuclease of restriction endonuclease-like (RecB) superfamily